MKPSRGLVHVVDDDESLRDSLVDLLHADGSEARGYASAGAFLLHPLPEGPACLLLEVRLPGPSGIELQAALRERGATLPIVFLTGHADVPTWCARARRRLRRAGKAGRERLLEAINAALAEAAQTHAARGLQARREARLASLTPREREVFERIVAGQRNPQIAAALGIGLRTVKAHRAQLMAKLGVGTAAELGRLAGEPEAPAG